eukprot:g78434.t1
MCKGLIMGFCHICLYVQVNTRLTKLDVSARWDAKSEEKIGAEGAKAFADALKVNTSLLFRCDTTTSDQKERSKSQKHCRSITC